MVLKKLPSQYKPWVFAFIMSFNTALVVSGVISFIYSPSIAVFWHKWQMAFFLGWPVVFISIMLLAPIVTKLVSLLVLETD